MRLSIGRGATLVEVVEPCLMPRDVRELAKWLRRMAQGHRVRPLMDFLEPTLSFAVVEAAAETVLLRIAVQGARMTTEVHLRLKKPAIEAAGVRLQEILAKLEG